jgi:hypothetical protein
VDPFPGRASMVSMLPHCFEGKSILTCELVCLASPESSLLTRGSVQHCFKIRKATCLTWELVQRPGLYDPGRIRFSSAVYTLVNKLKKEMYSSMHRLDCTAIVWGMCNA